MDRVVSMCIFLYHLLMMQRPYIGCSGFQPLWVVNATEVTPLPSNGALMGSNGLTVWLGNHLECLLVLNDFVSPSGMANPFTRQRTFVIVTSSRTSVCLLVLSISKKVTTAIRKLSSKSCKYHLIASDFVSIKSFYNIQSYYNIQSIRFCTI